MNTVIAVVATGSYVEGARVLFHSLEQHGLPDSIHRIVIGTESCNFAEALVPEENFDWIGITDPRCKESLKNFLPLKLNYDRVISMNADMLCVGDPSYLWSDRIGDLPFYACHDTAAQVYYPQSIEQLGLDPLTIFNAGLYVYHRSRLPRLYEDMTHEIAEGKLQTYEVGDQGFWNHYFHLHRLEVGWLPSGLNYCLDKHFPIPLEADRRIIHFTGKKPWAGCPPVGHWTHPYYQSWNDERARSE